MRRESWFETKRRLSRRLAALAEFKRGQSSTFDARGADSNAVVKDVAERASVRACERA
jgi:hypothetical protein